jgi:hypothetical protein
MPVIRGTTAEMDQPRHTRANVLLQRPVHRACVVAGCWCGATTTAGTLHGPGVTRTDRLAAGAASIASDLTRIAWRSAGLPVV